MINFTKQTFATLLACALGCQAFAGQQITIKSSSEGDGHGRGQRGANNTVTRMTTDADKARMDFIEGQGPGAEKGSYMLTQDGGKTFLMVSSKDKTYMKWDMDAMMNMAGAMGGMMKMEISDPKVETIADEAGAPILGYPTRHYKFRTTYHMSMQVMGFNSANTIVKEDEVWTTTKLDLTSLSAWIGNMPKTKNENLDKLIQAEKGKMKGVLLKMYSVQTSTDSNGKASTSKTHMEVTEIKSTAVAAATFAIPEDYKEISMGMPMAPDADEDQPKSHARPRKGAGAPPKIDIGELMKKAMEQQGE